MEIILNMSKELGKSFNNSYNNYVIGKIIFKKYIESDSLSFVFKEEQKKINYKRCFLQALNEDNLCYFLEIVLLKNINRNKAALNKLIECNEEAEYFKAISKKNVEDFMLLTKDFNIIHKGERPVVQGLLLLSYIDNYLNEKMEKYSEIEIKFLTPIYANEELKISINGDEILLLRNSKIVLRGKIKWKTE